MNHSVVGAIVDTWNAAIIAAGICAWVLAITIIARLLFSVETTADVMLPSFIAWMVALLFAINHTMRFG